MVEPYWEIILRAASRFEYQFIPTGFEAFTHGFKLDGRRTGNRRLVRNGDFDWRKGERQFVCAAGRRTAAPIAGSSLELQAKLAGRRGPSRDDQRTIPPREIQIHPRRAQRHVVETGIIPGGGQMRSQSQRVSESVPIQTEEPPQGWRNDHCGRPDLVRTAA